MLLFGEIVDLFLVHDSGKIWEKLLFCLGLMYDYHKNAVLAYSHVLLYFSKVL